MDTIWMSHPKLDDRKVQVPATSRQQRLRAGWVECDPPTPPPIRQPESSKAPATAGASSLPETESPKGRRTKGDEQ